MADYIWARGCRLTNKTADAQVIGDTLDQLQQQHGGRITPKAVVETARPIDSVLHPCFEWDDAAAAELFREDQARHVVASIRVVQPQTDPREAPRAIHAYVSLMEDTADGKARAYVPIMRVLSDADLLRQMIQRAAAELRVFEARYAEFDLIASTVRGTREVLETMSAQKTAA